MIQHCFRVTEDLLASDDQNARAAASIRVAEHLSGWKLRGLKTVTTVKKALITPLRERFSVEVAAGPDLEVHGNVVDHEYRITQGGDNVAEVSKKWFRVADSYGVEIADGQEPVLILAVTAVIDTMTHRER